MKNDNQPEYTGTNNIGSFSYKPRVSFALAQVCGAEIISRHALTRSFANETLPGLLTQIATINQAVRPLKTSYTIPAQQLMDDSVLRRILLAAKSGLIHNGQLELLLSDISSVANQAELASRLQRLADINIGIIMSDFGTAFSSMDLLTQLPFTGLMLNEHLVQQLGSAQKGYFIAEAAIRMARSMGLTIMADGARNTTEFGTLVRLGCEQVQGDWVSPPLSLGNYIDFVRHDSRWGALEEAA